MIGHLKNYENFPDHLLVFTEICNKFNHYDRIFFVQTKIQIDPKLISEYIIKTLN